MRMRACCTEVLLGLVLGGWVMAGPVSAHPFPVPFNDDDPFVRVPAAIGGLIVAVPAAIAGVGLCAFTGSVRFEECALVAGSVGWIAGSTVGGAPFWAIKKLVPKLSRPKSSAETPQQDPERAEDITQEERPAEDHRTVGDPQS